MKNVALSVFVLFVLFSFSSCLTSKSLDKYVAGQYNNEIPKPNKKKKAEIEVTPPSTGMTVISTTVHKTDKFLPLIIYWKYDHRQTCSLNPSIPITYFENAINGSSIKKLTDKLNGHKLQLTVEQVPESFSIVAKENVIWLVYAFSWAKIYIEPDTKDLVVSYKVMDGDNALKTGSVTVKNTGKNKGIHFFQSWKSATSEYLTDYNANLANMTKSFITQLADEL
jgi:hypothetical protein